MNTNRKSSVEYLSKDILEREFVSVFKPMLTAQFILGCSRVDARDQFVSPPNKLQKLYTLVMTAFVAYYSLSAEFAIINDVYKTDLAMRNLSIVAFVIDVLSFVGLVVHARFFCNDANVNLYIRMQKIDRLLKLEHSTKIYFMQQLMLIVMLTMPLLTVLALMPLSFLGNTLFPSAYLGLSLVRMAPTFELSLCANLAYFYFLVRIRFINSILKNDLDNKNISETLAYFPTNKMIRFLAHQTHSFKTSPVDIYLKEILDCFSCFQRLYRIPIALYITNFFIGFWISTIFIVYGFKNNTASIAEYVIVPAFSLTGVFLLIFLNIQFELFFREIKKTKASIVEIMSVYWEGPQREIAKNMMKEIEELQPYYSIYGMWSIDAVHIVKTLNILTNLTVTILQLAFL